MISTAVYENVKAEYAELGVDTDQVLRQLKAIPISLHCWQGDDVVGFESGSQALGDGLAVTGNYPGKARTISELRQDLDQVIALLPGEHRLNLHAIYGDFENKAVARDEIEPQHFKSWLEWCQSRDMGIDFNPSCFSHPKASDGFTLSHPDSETREFWVRHCQQARKIGAYLGEASRSPCVTNIWVPDGMKDSPANRRVYRERLQDSLNTVLAEPFPKTDLIDAVESKLFGIGSESFVVGSHEFYLGYAQQKQIALCLDMGHFHPTESIADKISSVMLYVPHLLLHLSRGVRWDSDHVVTLDSATTAVTHELVRGGYLERTSIGLDFFDASINRIAAWVIGTRAARKALLVSLLEPVQLIQQAEAAGDYTQRLLLMEQSKSMPWGVVWSQFCKLEHVPPDHHIMSNILNYESQTLSQRN